MGDSGLSSARRSQGSQIGARFQIGQVLDSGVGHLLVGEDTCDATISGSKHGQQAVPGGSRGVWS